MKFKAKLAWICLLSCSAPSYAGPYGDDLAKCLVGATTQDDRIALVRWMFAAASAHPAVASISSVSAQEMQKSNETVGALFVKLLTESCKDKAKTALQYEGPATMQLSFQVLGQVAASELFSSPEVKQAMAGLQTYFKDKQLDEVLTQK